MAFAQRVGVSSRVGSSGFAEERRVAFDIENVVLDLKGEADFGADGTVLADLAHFVVSRVT